MKALLESNAFHIAEQMLMVCVWVFHGFYSKILNGIPRHRMIVARVLGSVRATSMTRVIGVFEVLLGIWALTGWRPIECAATQTAVILAMNALEIRLAKELLISAAGMVVLNLGFLTLVWHWALSAAKI